jgi:hypothetical protein
MPKFLIYDVSYVYLFICFWILLPVSFCCKGSLLLLIALALGKKTIDHIAGIGLFLSPQFCSIDIKCILCVCNIHTYIYIYIHIYMKYMIFAVSP